MHQFYSHSECETDTCDPPSHRLNFVSPQFFGKGGGHWLRYLTPSPHQGAQRLRRFFHRGPSYPGPFSKNTISGEKTKKLGRKLRYVGNTGFVLFFSTARTPPSPKINDGAVSYRGASTPDTCDVRSSVPPFRFRNLVAPPSRAFACRPYPPSRSPALRNLVNWV